MNCTRLVSSASAAARRADEQRLGDAGDALEQDVPAAEQRDDEAGHRGVLADDGLGDLAAQGEQGGAGLGAGVGGAVRGGAPAGRRRGAGGRAPPAAWAR